MKICMTTFVAGVFALTAAAALAAPMDVLTRNTLVSRSDSGMEVRYHFNEDGTLDATAGAMRITGRWTLDPDAGQLCVTIESPQPSTEPYCRPLDESLAVGAQWDDVDGAGQPVTYRIEAGR